MIENHEDRYQQIYEFINFYPGYILKIKLMQAEMKVADVIINIKIPRKNMKNEKRPILRGKS